MAVPPTLFRKNDTTVKVKSTTTYLTQSSIKTREGGDALIKALLMTKQKRRRSPKTTVAINAGMLHLACWMYKIISSSLSDHEKRGINAKNWMSVWGNGGRLFSTARLVGQKIQMHATLALLQRLLFIISRGQEVFLPSTLTSTPGVHDCGEWAEHSYLLQA